MRSAPTVTRVRFTPSRPLDAQSGLLGWLACDIDGFSFDGLALRRTTNGHLRVAYPARRSRDGHKFTVARPSSPALEAAISDQVLAALRAQGVVQ